MKTLLALMTQKKLLRVHFNQGREAMLSTILEVDAHSGYLVIDCASDGPTNQRLLDSHRVEFESVLDNIRVLFNGTDLAADEHAQMPAISLPIPTCLWRVQRRDSYRVPTSLIHPVYCTVRLEQEGQEKILKLPLLDISVGGVALLDDTLQMKPDIGQRYTACQIELPDQPALQVSLQICNIRQISRPNGSSCTRLGCQFLDLTMIEKNAIQRYIHRLEREHSGRNNQLF